MSSICTKCKTKIGFFGTEYKCDEEGCKSKPLLCTDCYNKCSDEVLAECETCAGSFCPEHFDNHSCEDEETCEECGELTEDCTCDEEDEMDEKILTYSTDKTCAYVYTSSDCKAIKELNIIAQLYIDGYEYVGPINESYILFRQKVIPPKEIIPNA